MDYQQAIDYLSSYTDYEVVPRLAHNAANYDLRRVEELLSLIGDPHRKARSVHVAGTNGKGSTAAMVASVLAASGYITGLYTSPHLHSWRERVQVNGTGALRQEPLPLPVRVLPRGEPGQRGVRGVAVNAHGPRQVREEAPPPEHGPEGQVHRIANGPCGGQQQDPAPRLERCFHSSVHSCATSTSSGISGVRASG